MNLRTIVAVLTVCCWDSVWAQQVAASSSLTGWAGIAQYGEQQPDGASATTTPASAKSGAGATQTNSRQQTQGTSKDRLFFALPNFLTVENAGKVPPLTTAQKFKVVSRDTFDPVEFLWYGLLAGISQARDSEAAYGQGAEGYAKRYGSQFADGTIENFAVKAIFPSLLHQDPRYYQMGKGGFWHRTGYAVSRIFVTRSDGGQNEFNYSEVLGSGVAAGISTYSYHPKGDRSVPAVMDVWGTQIGYDVISVVAKEFWPDIRRKLRKQHSEAAR